MLVVLSVNNCCEACTFSPVQWHENAEPLTYISGIYVLNHLSIFRVIKLYTLAVAAATNVILLIMMLPFYPSFATQARTLHDPGNPISILQGQPKEI